MKDLLFFKNVYVNAASATVGKKEAEGPLADRFDGYETDEYFGCKSFEEAESEMVRRNINLLMSKTDSTFNDVDVIIGGDLINQCTATSFAVAKTNVSYLGLYGACTTFIESIICASAFIKSNNIDSAISIASSHFCSAERQYRFPLEYGSIRTPTAQNTVTGTGAMYLSNKPSSLSVKSAVIGRIIDKGITDANNMGAAMACAAVDSIKRFFKDGHHAPEDFDLIVTGDLGYEGHAIAKEMLGLENINLGDRFSDCGIMIYDKDKQDTHCGGSGCGCIASVLSGHIIRMFEEKKIKNVLAIGTGALLNPNSVFQKQPIPGIAHAVHLSMEE